MDTPDFSDFTVLIAEDDLSNFKYLESSLKNTNLNMLHAKNGEEATHLFEQHPETNLIIMDAMMPKMNGFDATEKIKALQPAVPVIILTAFVNQNSIRQAVASGCNDYLAKPIQRDVLIAALHKWLPEK